MLKVLTLVLFVGSYFNAIASSKGELIKQIKSVRILTYKSNVFAGSSFYVHFDFILNSGEVLSSKTESKIGFRDFKIKIGGSAEILGYRKGELKLSSKHDALEAPYIDIHVEMKRRPDISCFLSVPVHFSDSYIFTVNGKPGKNGEHRDSRNCGFNGCHGRSGTDGERGEDLDVYVSTVEFPRDGGRLVKIEIIREDGKKYTRYVEVTESITILSEGGAGGTGGHAGNGKNGSPGYNYPDMESDCPIEDQEDYGGDGGDGQDGGIGGNGGDGGNGGRGGNINLYFKSDAMFFKDQIVIKNNGGVGGEPGMTGRGGVGGVGGLGSQGNLYWGENGEDGENGGHGKKGNAGAEGKPGEVNYYEWK